MGLFAKRKSAESDRDLQSVILGVAGHELIGDAKSAMSKSVWVYRAVATVATRIGSLPWGLYQGDKKVGNAVLQRPNPYQTASEMWEQVIAWQMLRGYGAIYCEPMNVRALDIDFVVNSNGTLTYIEGGSSRALDPGKLCIFPNFGLGGPGLSELSPVLDAANMDENAKKVWNNQMSSGGVLSGLLSSDVILNESQLEAVKKRWEERYGGVAKAGTMAFLGGGFKFTQMGISAADMRMLEVSQVTRNEIGTAFGVPGIFLGDMDSVDYSNAQTQERILYSNTVVPKADRLAKRVTTFLLPILGLRGVEMRFDYHGIDALQENKLQRAQIDEVQTRIGALTINEIRVRDGLDPVPWGDAWWGSAMLSPITSDKVAPVPEPAPESTPEPVKQVKGLHSPEARVLIWKSFDSRLKPEESKFSRETVKEFDKQGKRIVAWLEGKAMTDVKAAMPAELLDDEELLSVWRPLFMAFGMSASEATAARYDWTKIDPAVVRKWIDTRGAKYSKWVNETTNADIMDILATDRAGGLSIPDMVKHIQDYFGEGGVARSRAEAVARTQVIAVNNYADVETYKENGVQRKEWLATMDDRVRDSHAEMDGQVVAVDDPFVTGNGASLQYPGDPDGPAEEVINCRCTILPVID